ncbi:MAG: site-specific DNA-methyltransferase [Armatimonadetes bacterium]|nr:MAG: site-specific DNA-methyltransferase [Armatimonadota bacterium]
MPDATPPSRTANRRTSLPTTVSEGEPRNSSSSANGRSLAPRSRKGGRRQAPSHDLSSFVPSEIGTPDNPQTALPKIAKDAQLTAKIEARLRDIPTHHLLRRADARQMNFLEPKSVHLVVTSPPYWTLKEYRRTDGQLGFIEDYEAFLAELDLVWEHCYRALVPGGRLICVVGDVCLSRRKNKGRHTVVPLHASIQEHCRKLGFDNLAPIIWHKIANASYEVENGSSFLGKPYEPNAVIKNDIEFILMERKPGGYRSPSVSTRILSVISAENHQRWFQQIWSGLTGASTRNHPAPFPLELAERLIRMFSFVGDTVLDPFLGTGTTSLAALRSGRNSIGVEVDPHYFDMAHHRLLQETGGLFSSATVETVEQE